MVTLIFKFETRKGQRQVKLGQIRSNFKVQHFLTKLYLSCAVLSPDFKKSHLFLCTTIKMPKNAFQKCDIIFTWYLGHCTGKNKAKSLKLCTRVVCMCLDHIYSVFLKKIPRFGKYLKKSKFLA